MHLTSFFPIFMLMANNYLETYTATIQQSRAETCS